MRSSRRPARLGYEQPVRRVYHDYTDGVRGRCPLGRAWQRDRHAKSEWNSSRHVRRALRRTGIPGQLHHERGVHLLQHHWRPRRGSNSRSPGGRSTPRNGPVARGDGQARDPHLTPAKRARQAGQGRGHLDRHRRVRTKTRRPAWSRSATRLPTTSGIQDLRNGVVAGRALDNKVGAWVVGEALRRLDGAKLQASVHAVATVQEEIGLRGAETSAFGIAPASGGRRRRDPRDRSSKCRQEDGR